jgi:hypothetical protein
MEFVQSLADGDTIPSVILWRSPNTGNVFVIDGAHRLSAVLGWIKDDYGDKEQSQKFFNFKIPPEQQTAARETRDLIAKHVGSYQVLEQARSNPSEAKPEHIRRANNLLTFRIYVQWIHGDARNAEESFSKINQRAVPIDKTELKLIKARKQPVALATRSIIRAGTGHKYWKAFPAEAQERIESIAVEIYGLLFEPSVQMPIRTLDLPIGGSGYSAATLRLVLDFVTFANKPSASCPDDRDGSETVAYLQRVWKLTARMCGKDAGSLGLHPAVYFYSRSGNVQPTAFLATVRWIDDLESRDAFPQFTKVRSDLENFLVNHNSVSTEAIRTLGSGTRPVTSLVRFFNTILKLKLEGKADDEVVKELSADAAFRFAADALDSNGRADFSKEVKSAAFFRDALQGAPVCKECGARIHPKSISVDHTLRKADGGKGNLDNAELMHPYCNSGIKGRRESLAAQSKLKPKSKS